MSLDFLSPTRRETAWRIILYGGEGVGKSTFAARLGAGIMDIEGGLARIDAVGTPVIRDYDMLVEWFSKFSQNLSKGETLAIDTIDWLDRIFSAKVGQERGVALAEDLGYGKGPVYVAQKWVKFCAALDTLIERGVNVLMLAHSEVKTFSPPDSEAYDRYQPKLHSKSLDFLKQWSDATLFWGSVATLKRGEHEKTRAVGSVESLIEVGSKATHVGKNRLEELTQDAYTPEELLILLGGK